ncbi:Gag-Pol polyprotein, partial [Mucuna pruriens]
MLLLQEFNLEIRDKKGVENIVTDHLSRLKREVDLIPIQDEFPDEQILQMTHATPWYANICNFLVASVYPKGASKAVKEKLESDAKYYIWKDPYLWKLCSDQVIRRCILEFEIQSVLYFYHSVAGGGHYGSVVDYVSRWMEAKATKTNDAKNVVDFMKSNIFCKFGVPKVLISDQGSHFYNHAMAMLLEKYGVVHRVATAYHPQTNGQAKVFNRKIKRLLQKMANPNRNDWSCLLEDALWAHRTAYRTLDVSLSDCLR